MTISDSKEQSKLRLFIATYPTEAQQAQLGTLRNYNDDLTSKWSRKIRWVRQDKLHLTWLFLGNVSPERVAELTTALAAGLQHQQATSIKYESFVFWPSSRKPRQLVLVPRAVHHRVEEIAQRLRTSLAGFDFDAKPFKPHLTLARFAEGSKTRLELPETFPATEFLPMVQNVSTIALVCSHMGKSDYYETITEVRLQAPGD